MVRRSWLSGDEVPPGLSGLSGSNVVIPTEPKLHYHPPGTCVGGYKDLFEIADPYTLARKEDAQRQPRPRRNV
jgi:hypothetical protein